MPNYYKLWLVFENDESNINRAKQRVSDVLEPDSESLVIDPEEEPYKTKISCSLFSGFCNTHGIPGNDVSDCILLEFPLGDIMPFLAQFVEDPYSIELDGCIQLTKLVYHLWPKYMTQPPHYHNCGIFELLQTIKSKLESLESVQGSIPYPAFNLLGCISLLENGERKMWDVIQMRYCNAEEMLVFGLSQFDPVKYLPTLGKVFRHWDTNGPIHISGCFGDIINLVCHYKKRGVDIRSNFDMSDILAQYEDLRKCSIYDQLECSRSWRDWDT